MRPALAALLCGGLLLAGCARALHEPPPLTDLGGGVPPPAPAEVDTLLARADRLFGQREPAAVREAGRVYFQAAQADQTRLDALIGAARSYAWLTEHETDAATRRETATTAVQAAQWCGRVEPESPACAYWLGASLGLQARERPSTGLDALPLIEQAFKHAAAIDPGLYDGGPDRALALLYLRAPSWPRGPGDADLGLSHAQRAAELAPDYPPNLLALAEALEATDSGERARATRESAVQAAERRMAAGDPDAADWLREARATLQPRH